MGKKIVLTTEEWHYRCADGCCYDYGENVYVNGEQLEDVDIHNDPHHAIEVILNHLGYEVEWEDM